MSQIARVLLLVMACTIMIGCDSQDERKAAESKSTPKTSAPSSSNPLADQQQLTRDAKQILGLLDQDAAEKKAALNSAD